jgi:hypothetical protein
MILRTLIIFLALGFVITSLFAQNSPLRISGSITDSQTGEPLPYATVSVAGKAIGTISNTDGSFDFRIESPVPGDTLIVSMIGYARIKIRLTSSLIDHSFKLVPLPVQLDEVVVVSIDEIFAKVKAHVKDNYPSDKYQLECFYREIKKQRDTYRSLLEAAIVIEDNGYDHQKSSESVFIREIRGSSKFINQYSAFFQEDNLLRETLGLNAVRHPASDPSVFGKHPYKLKHMDKLMERPVYVLVSDTSNGEHWQRTLYVDTETYAIYRSEETVFKHSRFWKMTDNDSIDMRLSKGTSTFDFRAVNGRLYLNFIRHDVEVEYVNRATKQLLDRFTIINELMTTDIHARGDAGTRQLSPVKNYALEQQVTPYNESFWNNYNAIRQTQLEAQVMKDLVKDASLKEQFMQSSSESQAKKKRRKD